jgi:hypothetical protein
MDRNNLSAILDSGIAQGRISYGTEKVSDQFKRYDDAINFWGSYWGQRNKVVVAINGSYFNWNGVPESGQIISGWYAKRYSDFGGSSGFGYRTDRTIFIGQCVVNPADKQLVSIVRGGATIASWQISGVNVSRADNQLILYTPQYDDATHTAATGLEVLVELSRPTLVLPQPAYASGTVRKILDLKGATFIPFDHVVLSASGSVRTQLLGTLQVGDEVRISQEITTYDKDCQTPYNQTWTKTYASVSGGFNNLRDSQIIATTEAGGLAKNPRTVIAYNSQYIYFIVIDGRTQRSVGMTYAEAAAFARDTLGATWATTQDGGGSSVMVVNGAIKNHPVSQCKAAIFLPLVVNNGSAAALQAAPTPTPPNATPAAADTTTAAYSLYTCEREVANSMMMINVVPAARSGKFPASAAVTLTAAAEIRLGPGTNYPAFTTLQAGARGLVLSPHSGTLNGIAAKNLSWWKVAFGSVEGWVDERFLTSP